MIEHTLIKYLSDVLKGVRVTAEEPDNLKGPHVVIEKTGSSRVDLIDTSTVAIKSYGDTLNDALSLNECVKLAMEAMEYAIPSVSAVELDSDYNFSDTQKKRYRYQAVYDIAHY